MKTLKAIPYQSGYIFVDDSKIEEGNTVYCTTTNSIIKWSIPDEAGSNRSKIIAQTPDLNIEGIPYVELEEDIDMMALQGF